MPSRSPSILIAALALAAAGCRRDAGASSIVASGHVEATDVRVSSKVGGIVDVVLLEEGDHVEAGQALARIDVTDSRLALDTAKAEEAQADADLRLRLAGSRVEDVAEAAAQVKRAEADLAGAQKDLERMEGLLAAGSGTSKLRDDARTRRDLAASSLDAARERLRKLEAGSRPQEIDAARARLAAARARMAQLEQQIEDGMIASPVAGIVTEKLAERGELLSPGSALAVITDLAHAWLTVYVGEPDLGRIRIGQQAEVVSDDGQKRAGKVIFIASKAEFTPKNVQTRDERVKLVYKVKIGLPNPDGFFKPGMPAEAHLRPAERAS